MNSHEKMLGLLDLFDGEESVVTVTIDEMHERLGYTRSTLYRYLKTLTDAGLLTSLPSVGYMLGPRIVELDYKIRTGDVLIRAARPVMEELAAQFRGIALLCRRYRFDVLCVHQESGTDAIHSGYERGRRRSLLHGAASLSILAYLPDHQLRKFHSTAASQFAEAGFGNTLKEAKVILREQRQRGWVSTTGDVTPGVTGIASPVFDGRSEILGSLSLTLPNGQVQARSLNDVAERVAFCAGVISKTIAYS
ncbi:IclR family transcriptional regulator [Aminobacter sp. UC22_36]|uniref:IclR family transcriptional regulator n=1 Tax=Aminobacter sp. UC22_36 TaxID=3374549 RepID=UPI003757BCBE